MRELTQTDLTELIDGYTNDGFGYLRGLFGHDELVPLIEALDAGGASPGGFAVTDSEGGQQEASAWMDLGDDLLGVIPRLAPMVAAATAVIGEPVYHWHSKLSWKRPGTVSRWDWHQDYGFWAEEGTGRNAMCTIAIALGPINETNGCMRLIAGSHRLGTLDVVSVGQSRGSDPTSVETALASSSLELCELDTGDAVVFDGNTLHASGPNHSDQIRTMLMSSYNAISNPPTNPIHPGHRAERFEVLEATAIDNGWATVFGQSQFLDPGSSDADYGYSTTQN